MHYLSLYQATHPPTKSVKGPTSREHSSTKLGSDCIYLHTIVKEGHTALSINPYLGHILNPIQLEKGVGIQEGSLFVTSYALDIPSWGSFGLASVTRGVWTPFSGAIPSFWFKWAADLDAFISRHLQIKCSLLLQW